LYKWILAVRNHDSWLKANLDQLFPSYCWLETIYLYAPNVCSLRLIQNKIYYLCCWFCSRILKRIHDIKTLSLWNAQVATYCYIWVYKKTEWFIVTHFFVVKCVSYNHYRTFGMVPYGSLPICFCAYTSIQVLKLLIYTCCTPVHFVICKLYQRVLY